MKACRGKATRAQGEFIMLAKEEVQRISDQVIAAAAKGISRRS
jgi:hypothetical protein